MKVLEAKGKVIGKYGNSVDCGVEKLRDYTISRRGDLLKWAASGSCIYRAQCKATNMPKGIPYLDESGQPKTVVACGASPPPHVTLPTDLIGNGSSGKLCCKPAPRVVHNAALEDDHLADSEDDAGSEDDDVGGEGGSSSQDAGKLWTKAQFPEGTMGAANYTMSNLMAAQDWMCPCLDRTNCIAPSRLTVLQLYEHRKSFLTGVDARGKRDAMRAILAQH